MTFEETLRTAYRYPGQPDGRLILASLAILTLVFSAIAVWIPVIGLFVIAALTGLLLAYLAQVVQVSSTGEDSLPVFENADYLAWIAALFRYGIATLVPLVPVVASSFLLGPNAWPVTWLLGGIALIWYPASLILAAIDHSLFGPLNVPASFALVSRVPQGYAVLCLHLFGLLVLFVLVDVSIDWPFVPAWISAPAIAATRLAFGVVAARMLGLFLHHHEDELGFS